jgi:hypothetical protein
MFTMASFSDDPFCNRISKVKGAPSGPVITPFSTVYPASSKSLSASAMPARLRSDPSETGRT